MDHDHSFGDYDEAEEDHQTESPPSGAIATYLQTIKNTIAYTVGAPMRAVNYAMAKIGLGSVGKGGDKGVIDPFHQTVEELCHWNPNTSKVNTTLTSNDLYALLSRWMEDARKKTEGTSPEAYDSFMEAAKQLEMYNPKDAFPQRWATLIDVLSGIELFANSLFEKSKTGYVFRFRSIFTTSDVTRVKDLSSNLRSCQAGVGQELLQVMINECVDCDPLMKERLLELQLGINDDDAEPQGRSDASHDDDLDEEEEGEESWRAPTSVKDWKPPTHNESWRLTEDDDDDTVAQPATTLSHQRFATGTPSLNNTMHTQHNWTSQNSPGREGATGTGGDARRASNLDTRVSFRSQPKEWYDGSTPPNIVLQSTSEEEEEFLRVLDQFLNNRK